MSTRGERCPHTATIPPLDTTPSAKIRTRTPYAAACCQWRRVTVALRRADISGKHDAFANILDVIDQKKYLLLPNTSGARDAGEAVRLARLAAAAGLPRWVKREIHPDPHYLLPDPIETLEAAEILVKEGFTVLPYISMRIQC